MIYNESITVQGVSPFIQTNLDRLPEPALPDYPLTSGALVDFSAVMQGEESRTDPDYLASLPDLVAMCRAVSRSESPILVNPAYRDYHSIASIPDMCERFSGVDDDAIYWTLPTNGEPGRCGPMKQTEHDYTTGKEYSVQRIGGCTCGGRSHYGYLRRWHCGRPQCPDWHCLMRWAMDRAETGADRLICANRLLGDGGRMMHVVLSFDPDSDLSWLYSRKAFNAQMRKAYALLIRAGMRGGVGVFHPLRWRGEDFGGVKGMPADALANGLSWFLGPHIHIVGYGWLSGEIIAEIYAETGIIIKCIASANSEGKPLGADDLTAILGYALSHAGVGSQINGGGRAIRTLRDFGTLSGRSSAGVVRVVPPIAESEPMTCPVCEDMGGVSFLHDLHDYMSSGESSPVLVSGHRYGVYCPKVYARRVRAETAGMSPAEIVQYAWDNSDICATRCHDPDDPAGLRKRDRGLLTPRELAKFGGGS